jgi:hypothetical protein
MIILIMFNPITRKLIEWLLKIDTYKSVKITSRSLSLLLVWNLLVCYLKTIPLKFKLCKLLKKYQKLSEISMISMFQYSIHQFQSKLFQYCGDRKKLNFMIMVMKYGILNVLQFGKESENNRPLNLRKDKNDLVVGVVINLRKIKIKMLIIKLCNKPTNSSKLKSTYSWDKN